MSWACPTMKDWIVALENAAWSLLADWVIGQDEDSYRVYAEPCDKHGPRCARVVYGMLLDHVCWQEENPGELAGRLVATMVPPKGLRAGPERETTSDVSAPSRSQEPPGGPAHEPIYRWHPSHAPCPAGRHPHGRMAAFDSRCGEWSSLHRY